MERTVEMQNARLQQLKGEILAIDKMTAWHIDQAAGGVLEIGRRLLEVKGLVPGGAWQKWMEDNLDYSARKAQQLMQYYERYGTEQESLFASRESRERILGMGYSKAVALLALDDQQQEEFLQENPEAEEMSTRQLQQAVREKKEAEKRVAEAETARVEAQLREQAKARELEGLRLELKDSQNRLEEARRKVEEGKKAEAEREREQKALEAQRDKVQALEAEVARLEQQAKEDPAAPGEEVLAEARRQAEEELRGKLQQMENRMVGAEKKAQVAGINAKLMLAQEAFGQAVRQAGDLEEDMRDRLRPMLLQAAQRMVEMAEEI